MSCKRNKNQKAPKVCQIIASQFRITIVFNSTLKFSVEKLAHSACTQTLQPSQHTYPKIISYRKNNKLLLITAKRISMAYNESKRSYPVPSIWVMPNFLAYATVLFWFPQLWLHILKIKKLSRYILGEINNLEFSSSCLP